MFSLSKKQGRTGRKVLIGLGLFSLALGLAKCVHDISGGSPTHSTATVAVDDRRAYDELQKRGYSDGEARDSAAAIRQLCEAGGGTDCR